MRKGEPYFDGKLIDMDELDDAAPTSPVKNGLTPSMDEAPHARLPMAADFQRSWDKAFNYAPEQAAAEPRTPSMQWASLEAGESLPAAAILWFRAAL